MRINVVGAGIMGLSTALALVEAGHRVTVFEEGPIPNPLGSSVDSHRLIRHPYGAMSGYARMINAAYAAWERMWTSIGQRLYADTGTLVLARDVLDWAEASLTDMAELGIRTERLNRDQLRVRAPMLCPDGIELAAWIDSGGVLMADKIVASLARHLLMRGVTMRTHSRIDAVEIDRRMVVLEDGERVRADATVVSAGPWVHQLLDGLKKRVTPSRQLVVYLKPPPQHQAAWAKSPMILDIHGNGGVYIVPPVQGTGLKLGEHAFTLRGTPDNDRIAQSDECAALLQECKGRLIDLDEYAIEEGKICFYTVESEERFIVECTNKVLLMTGFSGHGFKFGALMGRLAAGVITEAVNPDDIQRLAAGAIEEESEIERLTGICLG